MNDSAPDALQRLITAAGLGLPLSVVCAAAASAAGLVFDSAATEDRGIDLLVASLARRTAGRPVRMGAWLISEARRSSPPGMVSRSAGSARTGRWSWSPAAPRRGGGTCCCTARITAGLPVRATGRGLRRAGHASPARTFARALPASCGKRSAGKLVPRPVLTDGVDWAVFALEVPWGTQVMVDGEEHDRFD
jgi:hypothetical protein